MVYQRNKKAKGDPPLQQQSKRGLQQKSGLQPGPTGPATGQSGVLAGQPGGNRVPMEEPADPVCDRSTGPLTGGSGAPSGRPGGNRAATGHQPEKHQDDAKELRSLIRSDRPLDRAVRSVARSTGFVEEKC